MLQIANPNPNPNHETKNKLTRLLQAKLIPPYVHSNSLRATANFVFVFLILKKLLALPFPKQNLKPAYYLSFSFSLSLALRICAIPPLCTENAPERTHCFQIF